MNAIEIYIAQSLKPVIKKLIGEIVKNGLEKISEKHSLDYNDLLELVTEDIETVDYPEPVVSKPEKKAPAKKKSSGGKGCQHEFEKKTTTKAKGDLCDAKISDKSESGKYCARHYAKHEADDEKKETKKKPSVPSKKPTKPVSRKESDDEDSDNEKPEKKSSKKSAPSKSSPSDKKMCTALTDNNKTACNTKVSDKSKSGLYCYRHLKKETEVATKLQLQIHKDKKGRFVETVDSVMFVFDKATKSVFGKIVDDEIEELDDDDIKICVDKQIAVMKKKDEGKRDESEEDGDDSEKKDEGKVEKKKDEKKVEKKKDEGKDDDKSLDSDDEDNGNKSKKKADDSDDDE